MQEHDKHIVIHVFEFVIRPRNVTTTKQHQIIHKFIKLYVQCCTLSIFNSVRRALTKKMDSYSYLIYSIATTTMQKLKKKKIERTMKRRDIRLKKPFVEMEKITFRELWAQKIGGDN